MSVVRLARRAMATVFEVTLVGGDEVALRAAGEAALDEIERVEEQISLFLPASEIGRINRAGPGQRVPVSPSLDRLLRTAERIRDETDGAFDISVGELMRRRGFRAPWRASTPAGTRPPSGGWSLAEGCVTRDGEGVALDLGAIGKGWAIDRAVTHLTKRGVGAAFLHGGWSTMYALGAPPGATAWKIGLVDPRRRDTRFGELELRDRALSVSAASGRTAGSTSHPASHVVDPRTGGEPRREVAWAAASDATRADALSTAFLLLPGEAIRALCERGDDGVVLPPPANLTLGVELAPRQDRRSPADLTRRRFLTASAAAAAAFSVGLPEPAAAQSETGATVRLGIVGLGDQGKFLLSRLQRIPGAEIGAVCDIRTEALDEALEITGRNVETYSSHEHMLEVERLDGVVVATPTFAHAAIALDCLDEGASVFCEAPMADSFDDCRRLVRAAEEAPGVFQVGHQRRWSRLYPHAVRHYEGGSIGQLLRIRGQWNRRTTWRQPVLTAAEDRVVNWRLYRQTSGGLLLEEGCHLFDLASWIVDAPPEAVSGFGGVLEWTDRRTVSDTVQVMLRYEGGIQVAFDATLGSSYGSEQETIFGTAGSMVLLRQSKGLLFKEPDSVAAGWEAFARQELLDDRRGIVLDPEATQYVTESEDSSVAGERPDFHAELEAFVRSVRSGDAPRCGAREGMRACAVALLALDALEAGETRRFGPEHLEI